MRAQSASRTAMRVALRRAAHQLLDNPKVLDDPLALRILGDAAEDICGNTAQHQNRFGRNLRAFLVARSRYAEDKLVEGLAHGTEQYVILGAGLDTSAYRGIASASNLRIFEVDHPATQKWKKERLQNAGIVVPPSVQHVPVDFESQDLAEQLAAAGFQRDEITFVSWLGVVPYLTREAATHTFRFLGSFAVGSGVAFDYGVCPSALGFLERLALRALSRRVARIGEPFRLFFTPPELDQFLRELGFRRIEQLGSKEINALYFSNRGDGLRVSGGVGRITGAWT
jgi:methyltransferase (TIGR00027 family)